MPPERRRPTEARAASDHTTAASQHTRRRKLCSNVFLRGRRAQHALEPKRNGPPSRRAEGGALSGHAAVVEWKDALWNE
jgi:hypothetical protein